MKPLRFSPRIIVATVVAAVVSFGGLSLAYGGPLAKTWRGHGHSSKALLPETCGKFLRGAEGTGQQIDPDSYAYRLPSNLVGMKAGNSVDLHFVLDVNTDRDFLVWDMGRKVRRVDVFPSIDHPPIPEEAFEFTVYGSADPNPPDAQPKWVPGRIKKIYDKGWNNEWIADDFVAQWEFRSWYRYVGIQWGGPGARRADGDAEIDAVCIRHDDHDDHHHHHHHHH
jgi:hypothetical protein